MVVLGGSILSVHFGLLPACRSLGFPTASNTAAQKRGLTTLSTGVILSVVGGVWIGDGVVSPLS